MINHRKATALFINSAKFLAAMTCAIALSFSVNAVEDDLEYLPEGQNYDSSIPKPADVLGYPVGTWHVRHDQVVSYMHALAEASDRVSLEVTGYTHEQRPFC